jgi:putative acetyltransferase
MIIIRNVSAHDSDLNLLIGRLDQDLLQRYPADEIFSLDFNDPDIDRIHFAVAYDEALPVGCGAIRPIDADTVELKRFYVEPAFRRRGIAAQLLASLETAARQFRARSVKLEAGTEQPEACGFYQKHGYQPIEKFGAYMHCPSSLCFEKQLND